MRVLVVEDEVRLAATLQDLLELNGYTVDVCHDGEAGLDNALTSIYDVILLDVMLPKLDGFTVLRRLRAEGSTTPVLMLTARSELTDRVNGLDSGADYYLTKPFEPKELLACIRALTRRQPELRQTDALKYGDMRMLSPRWGALGLVRRPPPKPPPKKLPKMSPRSPKSKLPSNPPPKPPAPKLGSTPAWPYWSYRAFLSASERTS